MPEGAFGNEWSVNASSMSMLDNSGGRYTIQEYMGDQMNPSFTNNNGARVTVFGRFKNDKELICIMAEMITSVDANGLPNVGSYSVLPTEAAATTCGMNIDDISGITAVTADVTNTTDTTYYDGKTDRRL